jgi:hypothetical protein
MTDTTKNTSGTAGNTAVPTHGDHDRVAMLSLRADGTPDQHNPEIIGDKDFALAATKQQFTEQAVSAVDSQKRGVTAGQDGGEPVTQDPQIAELQQAHDTAAGQAEKAAESTVGALFTADKELTTGTAATPPATGKGTPKDRH